MGKIIMKKKKLKRVGFTYNGERVLIEVKECGSLGKVIGLMFSRRENADNLLFDFKKPVGINIHSFFCPEFVAVWIDENNKIVGVKMVKPFRMSVKPQKSFVKLIEIPVNEKNMKIIALLSS